MTVPKQHPTASYPGHKGSPLWCSIIIPTLNEEESLPTTLASLRLGREAGGIELIIVDGGSTDDTLRIAGRHGCTILHSTRGRAQQMNAGARMAAAPNLWFLHADTVPPKNWHVQLLAAAKRRHAATFPLRFDNDHGIPLLRFYGWLSGFDLDAFRFGDQSIFVPSEQFSAIGGYREELSLLEDNDLIRRLRKQGATIKLLSDHVVTSARKYRRHGVMYTQFVYVCLYAAFRLGARDATLRAWYRRAFG